MGKRKRRKFTAEQRAEAVKIALGSGRPVSVVAKELDLTPSLLAGWIKQAAIDRTDGRNGGLTTQEKAELSELRRDNKRLTQENAFLKKASAFFARESQ